MGGDLLPNPRRNGRAASAAAAHLLAFGHGTTSRAAIPIKTSAIGRNVTIVNKDASRKLTARAGLYIPQTHRSLVAEERHDRRWHACIWGF